MIQGTTSGLLVTSGGRGGLKKKVVVSRPYKAEVLKLETSPEHAIAVVSLSTVCPKGPSTQQSYTYPKPVLSSLQYYPNAKYQIIGSLDPKP